MVTGLLATFAVASPAAAVRCGFYFSNGDAYWRNCSTSLKEYVHVDVILWADDYVCLSPGNHKLGSMARVRDADMMYNCGSA
jgi:hypothetical protein